MNPISGDDRLIDTSGLDEYLSLGIAVHYYEVRQLLEIHMIRAAMGATHGSITEASKLLRMNRTTLHEKLKKFGIE